MWEEICPGSQIYSITMMTPTIELWFCVSTVIDSSMVVIIITIRLFVNDTRSTGVRVSYPCLLQISHLGVPRRCSCIHLSQPFWDLP